LIAFIEFYKLGHLESVAKKLTITQPALSYQLSQFEKKLGCSLFASQGKKKTLTPLGKALGALFEYEVPEIAKKVQSVIQQFEWYQNVPLKIACRLDRVKIIQKVIDYPGLIEFTNMSSDPALKALQKGVVDVAVVHEKPTYPDLVVKPIFESFPTLFTHKKYLKKYDISSAEFLKNNPCIAYKKDEPVLEAWLKANHLHISDIRLVRIVEDWPTLLDYCRSGLGFSIVPDDFINHDEKDMSAYKLPESNFQKIKFYAVFHQNLKKTKAYQNTLKIDFIKI